jgi:CofD-related protein of GAK system
VRYTHRSIHLITPFDSGGSSAELRAAFHMPAVGDLRNRLLSLAGRTDPEQRAVHDLFSFRLSSRVPSSTLRSRLDRMVRGDDPAVAKIAGRLRATICETLGHFRQAMPTDFDLRGASIGNLFLAGGYLANGRRLGPALTRFAELVQARGQVQPVVDADLHLAARLDDGRTVVGQHRLTGGVTSPVASLHLSRSAVALQPSPIRITPAVEDLIRSADLICYPIGSFYTSLVATLLPDGVAQAIADADAPRVYVPNPGHDREELGLSLPGKVETLLGYLKAGAPPSTPTSTLLSHVLLDAAGTGAKSRDLDGIRRLGVRVLDTRLLAEGKTPRLDDTLLVKALLMLA